MLGTTLKWPCVVLNTIWYLLQLTYHAYHFYARVFTAVHCYALLLLTQTQAEPAVFAQLLVGDCDTPGSQSHNYMYHVDIVRTLRTCRTRTRSHVANVLPYKLVGIFHCVSYFDSPSP